MAFRLAFLSLTLVGIGSFCFHMTLARPMQMFDETSMILVSLHGFYLLYIIKYPHVDRRKLLALLICYGLVFLCLYVFLVAWPIFHHTTFGLLVYASVVIGYKLKRVHGPYHKFWTVLLMQHLGFAFWLIDKHYCEVLTHFRQHFVPSLLRPTFQLHALWHLFMGLGSHIFVCGLVRLRAWTKYKEEFVIRYRWFGLWITLERVEPNTYSPTGTWSRQRNLNFNEHNNESLKYRKQVHYFEDGDLNNHELDLNQNDIHSLGARTRFGHQS